MKLNPKNMVELVAGVHLAHHEEKRYFNSLRFGSIVIEDPRYRTMFYMGKPYVVATPYIYYAMGVSEGFDTAIVRRIFFSGRLKLGGNLSFPMLFNVVSGIPCYPKQIGKVTREINPKEAILNGLVDYWASTFNNDDDDLLDSIYGTPAVPAWAKLAKMAKYEPDPDWDIDDDGDTWDQAFDRSSVLEAWEKLSIEQVLALPWRLPPKERYPGQPSIDVLVDEAHLFLT